MKRKCLAVGIILLFVGTCAIPSATSEQTCGKNIITVDNEPGDADYTSIIDALHNASAGDTIEVYSGTYHENYIRINKSNITLCGISHELGNGNDTGKPRVYSSAEICIDQDNIVLSGFNITTPSYYYGIWLYRTVNVQVLNNNLTDGNDIGIFCDYSNYCNISGNTIANCAEGIDLGDTCYCYITRNTISKCYDIGIVVSFYYNYIIKNTISDCSTVVWVVNTNTVQQNNFLNNTKQAYFTDFFPIEPPRWHSHWVGNYWGHQTNLPHIIVGVKILIAIPLMGLALPIPWINIDWHPAQEPYNIPDIN